MIVVPTTIMRPSPSKASRSQLAGVSTATPRPVRAYPSATAAAESLIPAGWRVVLQQKANGHWSALCSCGATYTEATHQYKAVAIGMAAIKAIKVKTGKA